MNYMILAPCKGCEERKVGCHGSCERYAEFVRLNELRKKGKMEVLETEYALFRARERIKEKYRKSKRK